MSAKLEPTDPVLTGGCIRTGLDKTSIKQAFLDHLFFLQGKFPSIATVKDYPGLTGVTSFYQDGSVDKAIYVLTVKGSNIYEIVP